MNEDKPSKKPKQKNTNASRTSSPRPTKPTAEKALSAQEIAAIIKTCGEVGVSQLKLGDLHVQWGSHVLPPSSDTEISAHQSVAAKQSLVSDELRHKEDRIAQSLIEDPVLAEELLISGELDEKEDGDEE